MAHPRIARIVNCDIFTALLYFEPDANPVPTLPPSYVFEEVYQEYLDHRLETEPQTTPNFAPGEDPFSFVHDHLTPYWVFEKAVMELGPTLSNNHSGIDWRRIVGNPHAASFLQQNYHHIAPIVDLWLTAITIKLARRQLAQQAEFPASQNIIDVLRHIARSVQSLSDLLPIHLRLTAEARHLLPPPNDPSPRHVTEYVYRLANSKSIRRVARLLPSIRAHSLMNTIQWVLNQDPDPSPNRLMALKLLQDIVTELGVLDYPGYMFNAVGTNLTGHKYMTAGGEASIHAGTLNDKVVIVRVPTRPNPGNSSVLSWQAEKMYKRGIINYWQIRHHHIVEMIGLHVYSSREAPVPTISMVMPKMRISLSNYVPAEGNWVPEARIVTGIASGLAHLHRSSIVHGDMQWGNVMLDERGIVKICDFGISRIQHSNSNSTSTPPFSSSHRIFMPPEIVPPVGPPPAMSRPTFAIDMFSCGMLFLCIAVSRPTETIQNTMLSIQNAIQGIRYREVTSANVRRPRRWTNLSSDTAAELWVLVQTMTAFNPNHRGSMDQVQIRLGEIFGGVIQ